MMKLGGFLRRRKGEERDKERIKQLVDAIDKMIVELKKQSNLLKEQYTICYEQAKRLTKEGITGAAKKWLATALVCKKMRERVESRIADLYASRVQVLTSTPTKISEVFEAANKLLEEAERERERAESALRQFGQLVSLRVEVPMEAEVPWVDREELEQEYGRLQEEIALEEGLALPEVPSAVSEAREEAEREEEEESEESR